MKERINGIFQKKKDFKERLNARRMGI